MNQQPTRLLENATSPAEHVIALAAQVPPKPLARDDWDSVMERAVTQRPSPFRHAPAFALSLALGIALVLVLRPAPPPTAPAPRAPELVATADARWQHLASGEISLQAGRLAVSRPGDAPIRVQTPDVVLETAKSRFLAEVTSSGTTVVVEEGEVMVRTRNTQHLVRAGESYTAPPPPEIPQQLLEVPTGGSRCAAGSEQLACLRAEANGNGLDAQAASYELGALQLKSGDHVGALETWQSAITRFPDGVLEPELRIAVFVELVRAHRNAEAVAAAKSFEDTFPADPRAADLRALRETLLVR
ncbi:MAG: FecR domain-containing protein [Archangium sp.]